MEKESLLLLIILFSMIAITGFFVGDIFRKMSIEEEGEEMTDMEMTIIFLLIFMFMELFMIAITQKEREKKKKIEKEKKINVKEYSKPVSKSIYDLVWKKY